MTNAQMIPSRFLDAQKAKNLYSAISACFADGGVVRITTYSRSTDYKSLSWFKVDKMGVYVRSGKIWACINYAQILYGRPKK